MSKLSQARDKLDKNVKGFFFKYAKERVLHTKVQPKIPNKDICWSFTKQLQLQMNLSFADGDGDLSCPHAPRSSSRGSNLELD